MTGAAPGCLNLRGTLATLLEQKAGELTVSMALIGDKVPGVASKYVARDVPAFLENYSPLRQVEDGLSHGLTDGGSHALVTKKRRSEPDRA